MAKTPKSEELEQKIAELTDALQRERADAMNVRRRSEEDRAKMGSFYKANVVQQLLPVIDNFERALKHVPGEKSQEARERARKKTSCLNGLRALEKLSVVLKMY